jgi:hypothetical protein
VRDRTIFDAAIQHHRQATSARLRRNAATGCAYNLLAIDEWNALQQYRRGVKMRLQQAERSRNFWKG